MYYIFDMDGTLIDSMPSYGGAVIKTFDDNGIKYPEDIIKIVTPLGFKGTAEYAVKMLGSKVNEEELICQFTENMLYAYENTIEAKQGVISTVKRLKSEGHSINVLTASPHATLDPCLKRLGLYELFDNVWSCDDFGTTKSDTKIYRMAAQRLGTVVSECVFLDDNINAVVTAKEAGMQVVGVYDKSADEFVDEMKKVCGRYIYTFDEI